MAILIKHTFTGANSTTGLPSADTGQTTQVLSGVWGIDNNQAYYVGGGNALVTWESNHSDIIVSLVSKGYVQGYLAGAMMFRVSDDKNYWLFRKLGDDLQLYKFVNGTASLVATKNLRAWSNGDYIFKIVAKGSSIECFINDVLEFSITDTHNQKATKHGLRQHLPSNVRYDDFLVESLTEEPIGTPVTQTYETKQSIYANRIKQHDMHQSLYQAINRSFDTKQFLYKNITNQYTTEQQIYKTVNIIFDTLQEIFNTGILRQYEYDLSLSIYADKQRLHDMEISQYKDVSDDYNLIQTIYKLTQSEGDISLVIHADRQTNFGTLQSLYKDFSVNYDTRQTIFNPDTSLIHTIKLKGNRNLHIYLKGNRNLTIRLKGVIK
ncbi:hypothetical protein CWR48_10645 [Oceanobacillus arenosus]|uniref:Uncharacterized protein n=1 Tax=Oceanobacillus arenosus TaxID=1229153 RepID=A0A3D8PQ10_9BACI|nr:hypothetical protein [Oceanobacillus arenosus]RDW18054.1 hypothetical protein CWR48_10645 [Oceanobacillus arenosus]